MATTPCTQFWLIFRVSRSWKTKLQTATVNAYESLKKTEARIRMHLSQDGSAFSIECLEYNLKIVHIQTQFFKDFLCAGLGWRTRGMTRIAARSVRAALGKRELWRAFSLLSSHSTFTRAVCWFSRITRLDSLGDIIFSAA